jgi:hypothetical protein
MRSWRRDRYTYDTTGKVTDVVIGVGGFLGMGQRDIAVSMDKLKFVMELIRSTSAPNNGQAPAGSAPGQRTRNGIMTMLYCRERPRIR